MFEAADEEPADEEPADAEVFEGAPGAEPADAGVFEEQLEESADHEEALQQPDDSAVVGNAEPAAGQGHSVGNEQPIDIQVGDDAALALLGLAHMAHNGDPSGGASYPACYDCIITTATTTLSKDMESLTANECLNLYHSANPFPTRCHSNSCDGSCTSKKSANSTHIVFNLLCHSRQHCPNSLLIQTSTQEFKAAYRKLREQVRKLAHRAKQK